MTMRLVTLGLVVPSLLFGCVPHAGVACTLPSSISAIEPEPEAVPPAEAPRSVARCAGIELVLEQRTPESASRIALSCGADGASLVVLQSQQECEDSLVERTLSVDEADALWAEVAGVPLASLACDGEDDTAPGAPEVRSALEVRSARGARTIGCSAATPPASWRTLEELLLRAAEGASSGEEPFPFGADYWRDEIAYYAR